MAVPRSSPRLNERRRIPIAYLLDTWAWIEYFRGTNETARSIIEDSEEKLLTSTITLTEIIRKYNKYPPKSIDEKIQYIDEISNVIPVTKDIALAAGHLRNSTFQGGTADAIILATARKFQAIVVTGDQHFRDLEDARYIGE